MSNAVKKTIRSPALPRKSKIFGKFSSSWVLAAEWRWDREKSPNIESRLSKRHLLEDATARLLDATSGCCLRNHGRSDRPHPESGAEEKGMRRRWIRFRIVKDFPVG